MGVNPTSMAEWHFPEVIIDIALFSSRTSSSLWTNVEKIENASGHVHFLAQVYS